jgi:hypothetical protein
MESALNYMLPIALGAVFLTLCVGIYSLFRGGDFNRSHSNRLMRLRVILQFVAIVLIMATLYFSGRH